MAKVANTSSSVITAEERTRIIEDLAAFAESFSPDADEQPDSPETADEKFTYKRLTSMSRPTNRLSKEQVKQLLDGMSDKSGKVILTYKPSVHNLITILNNDPNLAGKIGYDVMADRIFLRGSVKFGVRDVPDIHVREGGRMFGDNDEAVINAYIGAPEDLGGYGIAAGDGPMHKSIINAGLLNAFDPLIEKITSIEWDGVKRLDTAFIRWFKLPDNEYHRQISEKFMVAFVERRFRPGSKFDFMPILIGQAQGTTKTTVIEALALGRNGEIRHANEVAEAKKLMEVTGTSSIIEVPEMGAFLKLHHNVAKAAISAKKDSARGAYNKYGEDRLRSFLWFGTSNDGEFLRDPTGNRRYWPIYLDRKLKEPIDINLLKAEILQVYAEALWRYRQLRMQHPDGELPLFLTGEAHDIALELQSRASVATPEQAVAGWLAEWLATPDHSKFATIEISGKTYRSKFCLREAHEAYQAAFPENAKVAYDKSATALMSGAVALLSGVTKGNTARFENYGAQASYAVDPDWLRAQLNAEQADDEPKPAAAEPKPAASPANVVKLKDYEDDLNWG